MKKLVLVVAVSLAFVACYNGSATQAIKDSTSVDSTIVKADSTKVDSTSTK